MMNRKLTEFYGISNILQIPEIQKELGKEIEILYGLGVKNYEIEFLIDLKIKEEIITAG